MPRIVLFPAAAIALLISFAPPAGADAALAISKTCHHGWLGGWIYGYSFGFSSPIAAEEVAIRHCNQVDCKIVRVVRNKCMVLAMDRADQCGAIGIGHERSIAASYAAALEECASSGGKDCVVVAKLCDDTLIGVDQLVPLH